MLRLPPRSTRTDTLFPYPTLFRAELKSMRTGAGAAPRSIVAISPGTCRYRHGRKHPCPLQLARFLASAEAAPRQHSLFNDKPETDPAAAWRAAPGLSAICRGRTTD